MKTIYKITKNNSDLSGNDLFRKEWFCSTKKLAEAFKAEKEKSEQVTDGNIPRGSGYCVSSMDVMENEDDFYKKELR